MLKKTVAATALAIGGALLLAPTASAAPDDDPFGPKDSTAGFVSAFDVAAYSSAGNKSLIVSPYGTSQRIDCASFHGQSWCTQVDPAGNVHGLTQIRIPTGSSEWDYRTIYIYNPF